MSEQVIIESLKKTVSKRNQKISELQSEIVSLKKQFGIQTDGFIDTPSLNVIRFDSKGRPNCEKHGAMNCYDHTIYRCVMCGVAVQLEDNMIVVSKFAQKENNVQ